MKFDSCDRRGAVGDATMEIMVARHGARERDLRPSSSERRDIINEL